MRADALERRWPASTARRSSSPRRATSTPARSTRCRRSSGRSGPTAAGSTSTARSGCGPRADPSRRHLVEGIGDADSWTTDAHKWLNVPYDSGLALVRDPAAHHAAMTLGAAYYVETDGRGARPLQLGARVVAPCPRVRASGRRCAVLGRDGVADMIARTSDHARRFAAGLDGEHRRPGPQRRRAQPGPRPVRGSRPATRRGGDARTDAVVAAVQADGVLWLGGTKWHGRRAMRISVSGWATTEADVDASVAVADRGVGIPTESCRRRASRRGRGDARPPRPWNPSRPAPGAAARAAHCMRWSNARPHCRAPNGRPARCGRHGTPPAPSEAADAGARPERRTMGISTAPGMTSEEIVALSRAHTLFSWSVQGRSTRSRSTTPRASTCTRPKASGSSTSTAS